MALYHQPPSVAILTIIGKELDAVKAALEISEEDDRFPGGGDLRYDKVIGTRFNGPLRVQVHVQGKAGNADSADEARGIIASGARFLLLCGIAGGMRGKVKIGDVVVPRAVADTTRRVAEAGVLKPRPEITSPLPGVLKMNAAAEVEKGAWHALFRRTFPMAISPPPGEEEAYARDVAGLPDLHESVILSDNLLLRDPQVMVDAANDLHQQIRAGEMEAAGFVGACMRAYPPVPWYVVRGISDFADSFKNDAFQPMAARAAASCAAAVRARGSRASGSGATPGALRLCPRPSRDGSRRRGTR